MVYTGDRPTLTPPVQATIIFSDSGRLSGRGGCNNFFGPYTTEGEDRISIGMIGSTMMACLHMDFEALYLRALPEMKTYAANARELRLKGVVDGEEVSLVFRPALKVVE